MKQYNKYMDAIQVSDTLHQRLLNLETPKKRPAWKNYGMAAALLLVCGLGGFSVWAAGVTGPFQPYPPGYQGTVPEIVGDVVKPDIAIMEPGQSLEPGMKTIGGYEVIDGDMAAYYMLPYIEYGMTKDMAEMSLDWDLPEGCVRRELTDADFAALFRKEENLSAHLGWGDYTLTGWAAWYEDGSLWGAYINGYKGPMDHFELAFTAGDTYPPTCIGYGDGVVNELWDVPVTAYGFDGRDGVSRRVEFLHDGYGFRFDLTGSDKEQAGDLVSRLTRWLIVEGLAAENVTQDGAAPAHPRETDPNYTVGEPNWNDDMSGQAVETLPYNPDEAAEPSYSALDPGKDPDDPNAGRFSDGAEYG